MVPWYPHRGSRGMMLPVSLKRVDSNTVVAYYMEGLQIDSCHEPQGGLEGWPRDDGYDHVRDLSGKSVTNVGIYNKESSMAHR